MNINEIEMNTSVLWGDIETLNSLLRQLRGQMDKMFTSVRELDQMWDGPANDAFNRQFEADYRTCEDMCKTLEELTAGLQHAGEEYDRCERNVGGLISSVAI